MKIFPKTAGEVLDYGWNWSAWLAGDTIATSTWTVTAGLTVVSQGNDSASSSVFVSGGTADAVYKLTNRITTDGGRTAERTSAIKIVEERYA